MKTKTNDRPAPKSLDDILAPTQFIAPKTVAELTATFVEKKKREGNSESDYCSNLENVSLELIKEYQNRNFSFVDFCNLSKYLDLSEEKISAFFFSWILFLKKEDRVKIIEVSDSCYSFRTYSFIK